jgi:PIN domain nuclease of toxin-antitoxin system
VTLLLGTHTFLWFCQDDPFDRLLVAQAIIEVIPVVSMDVALDPHGITRRW